MKRFSRHLWMAALCRAALCPAAARAQSSAYYVPEAAGGQAVTPASATIATGTGGGDACACQADTCCNSCCNDCGGCGCGLLSCFPGGCALSDLGEAWKLHEPCCEGGWTGAGWLAQGFVWNPYQPNDRFNGPMTWNDRANEYQMNELFYYFGRASNTEGVGFDWGARADALYGTSYRWNTSAGFETDWGNGSFYGLAIPQAYVEAGYNNWVFKLGRWYSPVGYYVIGTSNNFFATLPFTFQYGEPFTHTGLIATNKLSDALTVGGAVTHGWDTTDNTGNPHAGGLITASLTLSEQSALAYVGVIGPEPNFTGVNPSSVTSPLGGNFGYTNRYLQTLVYTYKFSDDVMGVLQSDFGTQHDAVLDAGGNTRTAKWYGLNSYLYWNLTSRCQWGLNAEWFRDQGGFRVGQVLPSFGSPNARGLGVSAGQTRFGYDGSFYRLMFGPKYYFTPNIYGRAAFAWDCFEGKNRNPNNQSPYDDGTKNHQEVVVFDLIATF